MHETAAANSRRPGYDGLERPLAPPCGQTIRVLVLGLVLFPVPLFAIISISVEGVSGGRPVTGLNPVVAMDFGRVSAFEPLGAGISRTLRASDYALSTGFGLRVTKLLGGSSSYTLQARLLSAHVLTWRIDGVMLSTTPTTVATLQPYATSIPHTLAFEVPYTHAAGLVTTIVEVTAIAN